MAGTSAKRHHDDDDSTTEALLRAVRLEGDAAARQRLIELYLPLVESVARRFAGRSQAYDDLYQVGCIGLINAIDRFDPERGDELAAFAVPTIAGEIRRHLRDRGDTVRLPRRVQELRGPARRAQQDLAARTGRTPTVAEIASAVGAGEQDVALALDPGNAAVPLEDAVARGVEGQDAALDAADARLFLTEAARGLDERERRILHLRYVRDQDAATVAQELGISPRQLSRDTERALEKLRHTLEGRPVAAAKKPADAGAVVARPKRAGAVPAEDPAGEAGSGGPAARGRSGQFLVRLPHSLHAQLAREARNQGTSLNRYITSALEAAVHDAKSPRRQSPGSGPDTAILRAVVAVLVLLGVLAVLVVVLALSR
jgi:RNA polymerase sigma-B factor